MVIISVFRHFTEYRKSPGGQMFDRWQNFLKIFFSEKCSDFHENLPVSQFLRVESISEVCFPKKLIPGKFPGNRTFGKFLGIFEDLYGKTDANYLELFGIVY